MTRSNKKLYSETMRELSFLDADLFMLYQMKWGIKDYDEELVAKVGRDVYSQIPKATPLRINAIQQIVESMFDDTARKEWADRIEGKTVQTQITVNHDTAEGIGTLQAYTLERLNQVFSDLEESE